MIGMLSALLPRVGDDARRAAQVRTDILRRAVQRDLDVEVHRPVVGAAMPVCVGVSFAL